MSRGSSTLWGNRDFLKFWGGESISQFGSQITVLALPLTAVLVLESGPLSMGVLNAASYLPFLVVTLFAGVWIDRVRRKPVLVFSSLGRAVVIGSVPLLYAMDLLTIQYLVFAALVLGVFTVLFEVTYQAYLPTLVTVDQLVDGNAKLQTSASASQVGGPAIGGWLVGVLSAPGALLFDAVSFLLATVGLVAIRTKEEPPKAAAGRQKVLRNIGEGLRFTFGNRWLRPCVLEAGTYNLFWMALETVFLLYATHHLHLSAGMIGLVFGGGAVGALIGSLLPRRLEGRMGIGPVISASMVIGCAAPLLVPLAAGSKALSVPLLIVSFFVGGVGTTVANIHVVSLRQSITPPRLLGRMNASYRFIAWGTVPVGALLGGVLGDVIGLRPTLVVSALGVFASALWIVFSPIRGLHELAQASPDPEEQEPVETL